MCHGPLLWQIIRFTIPLIISGVLQMLFHSADLIVIGQLTSEKALAAVGATGSLTMLLINIFIGLSIGTNVLVARYLGKNSRKDTSRTVHTAIMTSLFGGAFLAAAGIFGFFRIYILAIRSQQHVLLSTADINIAFLIDYPQIARM